MIIRTFIAENRLEALLRIREELGTDAVIIDERKVRKGGVMGVGGKEMTEVVAARKTDRAVAVTRPASRPALTDDEIPEVQARLRLERTETPEKIGSEVVRLEAELASLRAALQEIRSGAVVEIPATEVSHQSGHHTTPTERPVVPNFTVSGGIQASATPPRVVALIGPTGVGKTTTIAKLAANFALVQRKRVGLLTLDTYRIAAVDQLRTYAQIMDVPLEIASSDEEVKAALAGYAGFDYVLIDTIGRSQKNGKQLAEMRKALAPARAETHLVLSVTTKTEDLLDIADRFGAGPVHRYLFTKLDETDHCEGIAELCRRRLCPVSYLTTGQAVPEDIEIATDERLQRLCRPVAAQL